MLETRTRAWRGAEIPAAGGTGNARSVAQVHAILANGGTVGGKRYMSEAGCRRALEKQISGTDLILGMPVTFGLGFGLAGETVPTPNPNTVFWGGYGGSLIIHRLRRARHLRVRDEQDGRRHGGRQSLVRDDRRHVAGAGRPFRDSGKDVYG